MHSKNIHTAGKALNDADKVLIMVHGRGGHARDILGLAQQLDINDFALLAPQAMNNTWYPYSFMEDPDRNEPWLSAALDLLKEIVNDVTRQGFATESIYFLGFSQGACLTLEFVTRHAAKYGGIACFTGGLIGDKINRANYSGDFQRTPVFISSGDPDPHVPLARVHESAGILEGMHAELSLNIYENRAHTISPDELIRANALLFK